MVENERFELCVNNNGQFDIIDHVESEEKNAICIYNDLGLSPFSSAKALCELVNNQDRRIKELEQELSVMKDKAYEAKCGWIEEFGCNIESQKEKAREEIYGEKAEQKRLYELKEDIEQRGIYKYINKK